MLKIASKTAKFCIMQHEMQHESPVCCTGLLLYISLYEEWYFRPSSGLMP